MQMGPGERAQLLRVFAALIENQILVPSTHARYLTTTHNSSAWASDKLFWTLQARHLCACTPTHTLI